MSSPALNNPLASTSFEKVVVLAMLIGSALAIWGLGSLVVDKKRAPELADNQWYIQMAKGDYSVPKPFNSRIVAPWLAGKISASLGISLAGGFLAVQLTAFAILHGFALLSLRQLFDLPPALAATATSLCFLTHAFAWLVGALYYPDLLFLAWTAIAIWAWITSRWWLVAAALFLALITRDSSALPLGLMIAVGAWISRQKTGVLAVAAAVVGQQMFFRFLFTPGPGNVHGLGEIPYLLLKLVSNSSRAYLGLQLWTNTLGESAITRASNPAPPWIWDLPPFLQQGSIRQVGVYPWSFLSIVVTFLQMAVTFGLPLLAAGFLAVRLSRKGERAAAVTAISLPGALVLIYGLLMLALGPATGTDLPRLIMAAWPACVLVGAGWFLKTHPRPAAALLLLAASTLVGWLVHFQWRMAPGLLILQPPVWAGCAYLVLFALAGWIAFKRWPAPHSR